MRGLGFALVGLGCCVVPVGAALADETANEATVRRFVEQVWNRGNLAAVDQIVAANFVRYGPTSQATAHGREAFKELVTAARTDSPDLKIKLNQLIAEGDKVTLRWTARGTNTGPGKHPPTGKPWEIEGTSIVRLAHGKIVEDRASWDVLDVCRQLGIDPPMDPRARQIATIHRAVESAWNQANLSDVDKIYAATYLGHSLGSGETIRGLESLKERITEVRAAFPDLYVTLDDVIVEGDKVVTRWIARGTHRGEFMGMAPTGKQMAVQGITIYRFADGKIQENWGAWDRSHLREQLGPVKPAMASKE